MIRPFIVPRQDTATNTYTSVPAALPNTLEKAIPGSRSPRGQVPMMVSTSPTALMEKMYRQ